MSVDHRMNTIIYYRIDYKVLLVLLVFMHSYSYPLITQFIDFILTANIADPNCNGLGVSWCCKFLQAVLHESSGKIDLHIIA